MWCNSYIFRARKFVSNIAILSGLALGSQLPALAVQDVMLTWSPSTNSDVAGYNIYCGTVSHVYTNIVSVGNVTNATLTGLNEGATYYFSATSYDSSTNQSSFSIETSYSVPAVVTNIPSTNPPIVNVSEPVPTLSALSDLTLDINSPGQIIALSGISSGTTNAHPHIKVTAVSSNPRLIHPVVSYGSPQTTGKLTLKPAANATGTATITVTVNNGDKSENLTSESFMVTVTNAPPTIDSLTGSDLVIAEDALPQTVLLTGITSGSAGEKQHLSVTVMSSNSRLIKPSVNYISPNTSGRLTLKPAHNATGTALITVIVNDGNLTTQTSFSVMVGAGSVASSVISQASAPFLTALGIINGHLEIQITGTPGSQIAVHGTSDFIHWTILQTVSIPPDATSTLFIDSNTPNSTPQFYRAAVINNN